MGEIVVEVPNLNIEKKKKVREKKNKISVIISNNFIPVMTKILIMIMRVLCLCG